MRKLTFFFLFISLMANANVYYVATNGSDSNNGTALTSPFKTIAKPCGIAVAGDQIYLRGGKYSYTSSITISRSGTASAPIKLEGYSGERALINFTGISFGSQGIKLSGSYWYIKGLDITMAGDNGMFISGAFNTIEFCTFFDNKDSGMQLASGAHDNKIINCDSYWNADPTDYGDADGFACKMNVGTNNSFYGCRSWLNCDDGWDGYLRGADNVSTSLENCWTWRNGYLKNGTDPGSQANGNGFKMGGSDDKLLKHDFILKNCVAFDNKAKGFDQNSNKGSMTIYNGSSYRNKGNNYSISTTLASGKTCTVINCLSADAKVSLGNFVSQTTNSWMSPFVVTSDDFVSLDTTGVSGPRGSDGSLPKINFLRLKETSDLINAGTNVGLPFVGSAPDLGAFEFGNASGTINPIFKELNPYFSGETLVINLIQGFNGTHLCKLFDLNGRVIFQSEFNSDAKQIDCSGLEKGFYIFELTGSSGRFVSKIIK